MMFETDIIDIIRAEREHAHDKHGPWTAARVSAPNDWKLSLLTTEVAEVAEALTNPTKQTPELINELTQVAGICIAWIGALFTETTLTTPHYTPHMHKQRYHGAHDGS